MTRLYERSYARIPVELHATSPQGTSGQFGSITDLSKGGLRVQTRDSLACGQRVEVFLKGVATSYAFCRVAWAHPQGGLLPSEAGLEFLGEAPGAENPGWDFLVELRNAYHNPAAFH
jgi:PilZ domain